MKVALLAELIVARVTSVSSSDLVVTLPTVAAGQTLASLALARVVRKQGTVDACHGCETGVFASVQLDQLWVQVSEGHVNLTDGGFLGVTAVVALPDWERRSCLHD